MNHSYFIVYKPYGMLSQFTAEGKHPGLADLGGFPRDVYPVGRLDTDSEGLLLLTNDKTVNHRLLDPRYKHKRTYWAQVEGLVTAEALAQLEKGEELRLDGKVFQTGPAKAETLVSPQLPERHPPIRFRANIPTSWIALTITEGKNRQVRRMTAAVGFPTLRLVRARIEQIEIGTMQPGEVREIDREKFYRWLKIQR